MGYRAHRPAVGRADAPRAASEARVLKTTGGYRREHLVYRTARAISRRPGQGRRESQHHLDFICTFEVSLAFRPGLWRPMNVVTRRLCRADRWDDCHRTFSFAVRF